MKFDLLCPVENQGFTVKTNSKTGKPYALFRFFNLSDKVIRSMTFTVYAFDAYGGALGEIKAELLDLQGAPKSFFAENKAVSLEDFPEAKHLTLSFELIDFDDETTYTASGDTLEISIPEPDYEEKIRLTSAAGEDACCYAHDAGTHWVCVCGRPNTEEAESCVRCSRDKAEVLNCFSSKDALSRTIAEQVVEQRLAEEREQEEKRQKKLERNKKIKKNAILTAIVIVALVVLCFIGSLIYGGINLLLGNSAAKKGDVLKAYSYYRAANSQKVGTVSEVVRGNSNGNMLASGILATDENNIYYLDSVQAVWQESKANGEKTKLADGPAIFLNAVGGWVYYIDGTTGQAICRVNAEKNIETVYELPEDSYFANLMLVGNEMYFAVQEPMKNVTPEMQEQMAAQGNTGLPYQSRLYRMKIGSKHAKPVSDKQIQMFAYHQGRIYYIDPEDQGLYSMNYKGNDTKKLVSGPIYGWDFKEEEMYYLDLTQDAATGSEVVSVQKASAIDGAHLETVLTDSTLARFMLDGDALYYLTVDGEELAVHKKTKDEDSVILQNSQLFNVRDGYVMYVDMNGQFMKSTFDKTGFENVQAEAPVQQPAE